jgi:hypothetical protein
MYCWSLAPKILKIQNYFFPVIALVLALIIYPVSFSKDIAAGKKHPMAPTLIFLNVAVALSCSATAPPRTEVGSAWDRFYKTPFRPKTFTKS